MNESTSGLNGFHKSVNHSHSTDEKYRKTGLPETKSLHRSSTTGDVLASDVDISGQNAMLRAAAKGNPQEFLTIYQLNSRSKEAVNFVDYSKRTALILASVAGCEAIAKTLLSNEMVLFNCQDRSGFTALMYAAQRGHAAIAELLLKKKANYRLTDNRGNTAIILAARRNQVACLETLARYIKDPANWEAKGEHGLTAEEWAQANERPQATKFIRKTITELTAGQSSSVAAESNDRDGAGGPSSGSGKDASNHSGSNRRSSRKRTHQSTVGSQEDRTSGGMVGRKSSFAPRLTNGDRRVTMETGCLGLWPCRIHVRLGCRWSILLVIVVKEP
ncbi:hypothetical protein BOX15_Mlig016103g2 [Macrostomum lignano]|uniref:Uncharacterized protein n=1 Tax=Macrostomum lignano TaxID=282301 RepID=A0A267H452_9PLAT|nr:hypothetical protein BOX15_Mlig016103g2 [Macrostomum lignano]